MIDEEFLIHASQHVDAMLTAGNSRLQILTRLANEGELLAGCGATVSILVVDENGLLRNGASPNLPTDYLTAIDRLKPNPEVGTCAAAAATGCAVFTRDFLEDGKWAELRHLPLALGFAGAWSMPIKDPQGKVLGTFGTYFKEARIPSEREQQGVRYLADAAALALERT